MEENHDRGGQQPRWNWNDYVNMPVPTAPQSTWRRDCRRDGEVEGDEQVKELIGHPLLDRNGESNISAAFAHQVQAQVQNLHVGVNDTALTNALHSQAFLMQSRNWSRWALRRLRQIIEADPANAAAAQEELDKEEKSYRQLQQSVVDGQKKVVRMLKKEIPAGPLTAEPVADPQGQLVVPIAADPNALEVLFIRLTDNIQDFFDHLLGGHFDDLDAHQRRARLRWLGGSGLILVGLQALNLAYNVAVVEELDARESVELLGFISILLGIAAIWFEPRLPNDQH